MRKSRVQDQITKGRRLTAKLVKVVPHVVVEHTERTMLGKPLLFGDLLELEGSTGVYSIKQCEVNSAIIECSTGALEWNAHSLSAVAISSNVVGEPLNNSLPAPIPGFSIAALTYAPKSLLTFIIGMTVFPLAGMASTYSPSPTFSGAAGRVPIMFDTNDAGDTRA